MSPSPTMMRAFPALVVAALSGCELAKISNQAAARSVAVSTVLTTPPITIPPEALAFGSFDAGLPEFDGGLVLPDGGMLAFDAGVLAGDGGLQIPAQQVVVSFFGRRQGANLDAAPVGVAGAQVRLIEVGGSSFPLADQGGGAYALVDGGFAYREGATYQFEFVLDGVPFLAEVKRVPEREDIPQFHPPAGFVELDAGTGFLFTRPEPPAGEDRNLGFVNVFPVTADGSRGTPTWTNVPSNPLQFLQLVVAPNDWKTTAVTIPGSAFPDADANYVIILQSAKVGGPRSENLFTGSAILAGTADVAIVKTRR